VDIIFDLTPQEVENELKYDPDFFSRIASVLLPGGDCAHAMMLSSCGCQRLLYSSMVCCIHENHTHESKHLSPFWREQNKFVKSENLNSTEGIQSGNSIQTSGRSALRHGNGTGKWMPVGMMMP
jgi:hypothetical protein